MSCCGGRNIVHNAISSGPITRRVAISDVKDSAKASQMGGNKLALIRIETDGYGRCGREGYIPYPHDLLTPQRTVHARRSTLENSASQREYSLIRHEKSNTRYETQVIWVREFIVRLPSKHKRQPSIFPWYNESSIRLLRMLPILSSCDIQCDHQPLYLMKGEKAHICHLLLILSLSSAWRDSSTCHECISQSSPNSQHQQILRARNCWGKHGNETWLINLDAEEQYLVLKHCTRGCTRNNSRTTKD